MNNESPFDPAVDAMLTELAGIGMRAARVVVRVMEIEQAAAEVVACWLPPAGGELASLSEALAAGQGLDAVNAAMVDTVPRLEILARALDRVSKSVRRSVALLRRMQAGWPRAGSTDDRPATVRRQVARGVADVIGRGSDGEAAERLFDDLAERLDDPGLEREIGAMPVEDAVRRICRDLGLAGAALADGATCLKPGVERTAPLGPEDPSQDAGQRPAVPDKAARQRLNTC